MDVGTYLEKAGVDGPVFPLAGNFNSLGGGGGTGTGKKLKRSDITILNQLKNSLNLFSDFLTNKFLPRGGKNLNTALGKRVLIRG